MDVCSCVQQKQDHVPMAFVDGLVETRPRGDNLKDVVALTDAASAPSTSPLTISLQRRGISRLARAARSWP